MAGADVDGNYFDRDQRVTANSNATTNNIVIEAYSLNRTMDNLRDILEINI